MLSKLQPSLGSLHSSTKPVRSTLILPDEKKVEFISGPSIEGQSAATRNLNKILQLLEDDEVGIIMGGVGKTTLVKNLNNELLKTTASSSKLPFY
ncbi:hypothetical protein KY290_030922 [Solanum tuberosum]|uniref:Uncharacterized protein n=1 Tax=Solanum tuberosum TaxID=4113 RepID=A0ABQ7U7P3_SOLTU|nr:hypothetical protein KY290_030922 [Solanum tuberosum]